MRFLEEDKNQIKNTPSYNNCMNLTRISRVRFWALLVARAGYAYRLAQKTNDNVKEIA
jgi:hypothetical protein